MHSASASGMTTPSKIDRATFGATRASRSMTIGLGLLRKLLWLWPLLAAVMLAAAGIWIRSSVEKAAKGELAKSLQTILKADIKALEVWMTNHQRDAFSIADDPRLRKLIADLTEAASSATPDDPSPLLQSEAQSELRSILKGQMAGRDYVGFILLDTSGTILSSDHPELVGQPSPSAYAEPLERTLESAKTVSRPFLSTVLLRDETGVKRAGVPTMLAAGRVLDATGDPAGALFLRLRPEVGFTEILQVAQSGTSGETYAFDKSGVLSSESRFDDDLRRIGLLPDQAAAKSILTIELRDPGVDMTKGARPEKKRADQPLTWMAASATAGQEGVNVEGYNDYRGVPVIGAWTWLPEYEFGVATEIDVAEAYADLYPAAGILGAVQPIGGGGRTDPALYHCHGADAKDGSKGGPGCQAARPISARRKARRRGHGSRLSGPA